MSVRAKLFQLKRDQVLRLSRDVSFSSQVRDVLIIREGARRVIVPADALWDDFFASPGADFPERDQPGFRECSDA